MNDHSTNIFASEYFDDETFSDIDFTLPVKLSGVEFQDCKFENCKLSQVTFFDCRFENCSFYNCDLSSVSIKYCVFDSVVFTESKLTGIQWADVGIPLNVIFRQCTLNYSSFIGVDLRKTEISRCIVKEVDFSETNLSRSDCRYSDFSGARFINTNLEHTNLSYATNYSIHPGGNKLKKTVFSSPEVLSLLDVYDIVIK